MAEAVAPVSLTASRTLAKTGFPKCVSPAFLGLVPPTTLVPMVNLVEALLLSFISEVYRSLSLAGRENLIKSAHSRAIKTLGATHVPCFPVNP